MNQNKISSINIVVDKSDNSGIVIKIAAPGLRHNNGNNTYYNYNL